MNEKPIILAIGGSDNCAGAGIQADLKTCMALGAYCVTTISAVTAQNDYGVAAVKYVGGDILKAQLDATLKVVRPKAVKIGMMPNAESVKIVADYIREYKLNNVIIDPVISATSGGSLMGSDNTLDALVNSLFPLATLITPNLPEFEILLSQDSITFGLAKDEQRDSVFNYMLEHSISNILLKGGHSTESICKDILYSLEDGSTRREAEFISKRIISTNTHGTGCTLSSAIASYIASGGTLYESTRRAKEYIGHCIERAVESKMFPINGPLFH